MRSAWRWLASLHTSSEPRSRGLKMLRTPKRKQMSLIWTKWTLEFRPTLTGNPHWKRDLSKTLLVQFTQTLSHRRLCPSVHISFTRGNKHRLKNRAGLALRLFYGRSWRPYSICDGLFWTTMKLWGLAEGNIKGYTNKMSIVFRWIHLLLVWIFLSYLLTIRKIEIIIWSTL